MKKVLIEFPGGAKGDLLISHFNKKNIDLEIYNRTFTTGYTKLRDIEFNKKFNKDFSILSPEQQEELIIDIKNSNENIISIHNLCSLFDKKHIDELSEQVNIVQLFVEEKYYKQVIIDSIVKIMCKSLTTNEKIYSFNFLIKKFGKDYKNYKMKYILDWELINNNKDLNDSNRYEFLYELLKTSTKDYKQFEYSDCKSKKINYHKLFLKPYDDYFLLCNLLNFVPDLLDYEKRIRKSFIDNPLYFANKTLDLFQFGYTTNENLHQ